jgi:energy-coupling factor transporter ATP-binding protein EcfA2
MSRLELAAVTMRHRSGRRERIVLADVDLRLEAGELAIDWGARRSGRSTLLRIAAGVQAPDSGSVLFDGCPLDERSIGTGVGYVAKTLRAKEEQGVLDQIAAVLLARGVGVRDARQRARAALDRAGGEHCAAMKVSELGGGESLRVAVARTLALNPSAIIIDEPAATVEISERDPVFALLRSLARDGMAVLASTSEAEHLAGADVALTLRDGQLQSPNRGEGAEVLELRRGA